MTYQEAYTAFVQIVEMLKTADLMRPSYHGPVSGIEGTLLRAAITEKHAARQTPQPPLSQ